MKINKNERSLCLTEEEAMGLLDIVMMSNADLSTDQHSAIIKLSEFCREYLRERAERGRVGSDTADTHRVHPVCAA